MIMAIQPPQGEHRARKRFGQNFLVDQNIIGKIISSIAPKANDNLIEIGPGQGALTEPLLLHCPGLKVIELDHDLIPRLQASFSDRFPNFTIQQGDALNIDFSQFVDSQRPLRIVGNLPYNISTPLLFHLLAYHDAISDMHFMLQKEVVDRLAASPGTKAYGRLSVMTQYYCQIQPLFSVPPTAFRPAPKVDSAVVRLSPYSSLPHPAKDIRHLSKLVNACFQQRRKTLRNSLKQLTTADSLTCIDYDLSLRPENLTVSDFVAISNQLVLQHG